MFASIYVHVLYSSSFFTSINRKENKRPERAPPPPRFAAQRSWGLNERGRGAERGRSRGRGRGGSAPPSASHGKRPQLIKQNSSDYANDGNEEWETASESSDVLEKNDSKNEFRDREKEKRDSTPGKKSFSSQRPSSDRQNRKGDGRRPNGDATGRNSSKEKSPNHVSKNGSGRGHPRDGPRKPFSSSKKENVSNIYRVDEVVPNDQTLINNAINTSLNQK